METLQNRSKLLTILTQNPNFFGKDPKIKNVINKILNNIILDSHENLIYCDMLYKVETIQINK